MRAAPARLNGPRMMAWAAGDGLGSGLAVQRLRVEVREKPPAQQAAPEGCHDDRSLLDQSAGRRVRIQAAYVYASDQSQLGLRWFNGFS